MEAGIYLNVTVLTLSRFSTDYNIPNREKRAHRNNYIFLFVRRSGNLVSHYIKDFVIDIFNVSLGFLARRNTQF